ncbi:MAG: GrpB family protein [Anaerolineales bacterium]|nr:GrpB family protein [Anaerolineales bacterium]
MQTARPILIVAYRPGWPQEFAAVAAPVRATVGEWALRIDHIGSTAVPGLAAKDIIDVQVTVADFSPELQAAFERAGYTRGEHNRDHVPPGASSSARAWEKQMYRAPAGTRPLHLHVRRAGSANGRYALLFRDYLRAHPHAAEAYGRVKIALAQHGPTDWDLYYDVKDPVCDILMAGAEAWATATGWRLAYYA